MADETRPKRIHLKGRPGRFEEKPAGAAISPGHLVMQNSDDEFVVHATSGGRCLPQFALEDALQGRTIDDDYAAEDIVFTIICEPGAWVYAWLALDETVVIGDHLASNGDGTLKKVSGSDVAIAIAMEAKDLSDSETADERIKVQII